MTDLLGRRCKARSASGTEYIYKVVAVWIEAPVGPPTGPAHVRSLLICGLIADGGGTAVMAFQDLQFEPPALRGS